MTLLYKHSEDNMHTFLVKGYSLTILRPTHLRTLQTRFALSGTPLTPCSLYGKIATQLHDDDTHMYR